MSKRNQEEITEEVEEVEVVPESVTKRKKAKKKDAISKWSGVIFLCLVLLVGLLLWVGGEMGGEPKSMQVPASGPTINNYSPAIKAPSRVIVE